MARIYRGILSALIAAIWLATGSGACSGPPVEPLKGGAFYPSAPAHVTGRTAVTDTVTAVPGSTVADSPADDASAPVKSINPIVSQAISPTLERAAIPSSTAATGAAATNTPTTSVDPGISSGQYMMVGGIVAKVNEAPVYASQVLNLVSRDLAAKSREMDASQFRRYAADELFQSREHFIRTEVMVAAAQRNLEPSEIALAQALTTDWRQKRITEAGGSLALARRRAAAEGLDFDEMVNEQHRTFLSQIFMQKKVFPRIQITAQDMRDYYRANVDTLFTQHEQIRYRMIRIDPANVGGKDAAIARVKQIQEKAAAGYDFAELARTYNSDQGLSGNGGLSDWTDRGAMRAEKLEAALLKLQPGQVTQDFIQESDGMFYVAKLEDRKPGRVAPFDDPTVQEKIYNTLRAQQFRTLTDQFVGELERQAIVDPPDRDRRPDDSMLQLVVQMAMQRYPQWAAGRS